MIERRVIGGIMLLASLGFAAVAFPRVESTRQAVVFLVLPIVLGTVGYWFAQRRHVSEIVLRARESAGAEREPPWRTRRRVASLPVLIVVALAGWAWVTDEPAMGAIFLVAFGGAELVAAHRLRRWERSHGVRVLHEPRWLVGTVEPQDFYLGRNAGA